MINGFGNTVNDILRICIDVADPEVSSLFLGVNKKSSTSMNIQENNDLSEKEIFSSSLRSNIPEDVIDIMYKAQETYLNSTNDGKIEEVDYSVQGATSQWNGIYLKNTTLDHQADISDYINRKINADIDTTKPVVLIYHTHTCEAYELLDRGYYTNARDVRSENERENIVRVGEEVCKTLEEKGYKTIHNKTVYDTEYSGAYERSYKDISKIIKENPSIQVVLDIHRGSIYQKDGTRIKTVTTINGTKAAQVLILSGCEDGNVKDFPNWEQNLTFALNLQKYIVQDNPGLARPLMFCSRRYNMHVLPCALQIEIGTDANTLAEAVYSARLFALSLADMLGEL